MLATDVGLRPAGLPCWGCGGSVLRDGAGELRCLQCGRSPEAPRALEKGERRRPGGRVGHFDLVKGRVV